MIRMDVFRLAEKLADVSGIFAKGIYVWLMNLGAERRINPVNLDIRAAEGCIWLAEDPDGCRLENFSAPLHGGRSNDAEADFWENRIFARQESLMD